MEGKVLSDQVTVNLIAKATVVITVIVGWTGYF